VSSYQLPKFCNCFLLLSSWQPPTTNIFMVLTSHSESFKPFEDICVRQGFISINNLKNFAFSYSCFSQVWNRTWCSLAAPWERKARHMYRTAVNEVTKPEFAVHQTFFPHNMHWHSLATAGLFISSLCSSISLRSLFDHIQLAACQTNTDCLPRCAACSTDMGEHHVSVLIILCICFIAVLSAVTVMGCPNRCGLSVQQSNHSGCDSKKRLCIIRDRYVIVDSAGEVTTKGLQSKW
jgi:hypothetical protein